MINGSKTIRVHQEVIFGGGGLVNYQLLYGYLQPCSIGTVVLEIIEGIVPLGRKHGAV